MSTLLHCDYVANSLGRDQGRLHVKRAKGKDLFKEHHGYDFDVMSYSRRMKHF